MHRSGSPLPIHSKSVVDAPVQVRRIEHKNPYDFTKEHRHTYFEVFFFEKGGGSQLIDFINLPVKEKSSYIVYPQQIHLLKRAPVACGRLIQFSEEVLTSLPLRVMLQQQFLSPVPAIFFEQDKKLFQKMESVIDILQDVLENDTPVRREISVQMLQALLLMLLNVKQTDHHSALSGDKKVLFRFQQLLEEQFRTNHQVTRYAEDLGTTERKLAALTKQFLGLSPLQVIHNRLLLEAKRLLLFEDTSHKEIAFHLGFDSPASFSLFIKNKTGFNPSELNLHLVNFHK